MSKNLILKLSVALFVFMLAGCENAIESGSGAQATPTSGLSVGASIRPTEKSSTSNIFKPKQIQVGEHVGSFTVTKIDKVKSEIEDGKEIVTQAFIDFSGEVEVQGSFKHYPLDRENLAGKVVFQAYPDPGFPKMEIGENLSRPQEWMVLESENDQLIKQFGSPGVEGTATLTIANYSIAYSPSETYDHATVVKAKAVEISQKNSVDVSAGKGAENADPKKESSTPEAQVISWLKFSETDFASERTLVRAHYKSEIEQIEKGEYGDIKSVKIQIAHEDLNADGKEEAIVALQHPYFSGYQANSYLEIFTIKEDRLDRQMELGNANINFLENGQQADIGVLHTSVDGWKDIQLNKNLWRWNGEGYDFVQKLP